MDTGLNAAIACCCLARTTGVIWFVAFCRCRTLVWRCATCSVPQLDASLRLHYHVRFAMRSLLARRSPNGWNVSFLYLQKCDGNVFLAFSCLLRCPVKLHLAHILTQDGTRKLLLLQGSWTSHLAVKYNLFSPWGPNASSQVSALCSVPILARSLPFQNCYPARFLVQCYSLLCLILSCVSMLCCAKCLCAPISCLSEGFVEGTVSFWFLSVPTTEFVVHLFICLVDALCVLFLWTSLNRCPLVLNCLIAAWCCRLCSSPVSCVYIVLKDWIFSCFGVNCFD